jgi:hypothetical protein
MTCVVMGTMYAAGNGCADDFPDAAVRLGAGEEVVQMMSKAVAGKTHGRTPDHPP